MKVTFFGAGYVGLVTGTGLAEVGHQIVCVDINSKRIAYLNDGNCPIYEPGLTELMAANRKAGRLQFSDSPEQGIEHGQVIFIAVGTPPDEDGSADLQYVLAVAKSIGQYIQQETVIVTKSTVPVGTADKVKATIQTELDKRQQKIPFHVVSNPEFLKEGAAVKDFMEPDRIVIGVEHDHAVKVMRELYAPFTKQRDCLMVMDIRSAELTKYAANAMLATKISFMNELSQIAERVGADIDLVRQGIGTDPRIGPRFIFPGCGYGGSCFPKDVRALESIALENGITPQLLIAVNDVNDRQKFVLFNKINHYFQQDLANKTFAVWGLSFKPDTDDMREASSVTLLQQLWQAGAKVRAFDPVAHHEAQRLFGERDDLVLCDSKEQALNGADALVVVTEWNAFRDADFAVIKSELSTPVIFDGRNIYDPNTLKAQGFTYYAIGRGESIY